MVNFSSDQLRCSLVQDHSRHDSINYILSRADNTLVKEVDIGGEEWPYSYPKDKKFFNWKFLDPTPDMKAKVHLRAMQEAFNAVQQVTSLTLDYEMDDSKKTDITIEWLEDIEAFDRKLSVLAHAWLVFPNSPKNRVMEFNDSVQSKWYFTPLGWNVPAYLVDPTNYFKRQKDPRTGKLLMLASQPTTKITIHELCHILGLRHDTVNRASMMYHSVSRSYIGGKIIKKSFHLDKVSTISRLTGRYGTSGIIDRMLGRWQGRRTRESTYRRYA